MPDSSRPRLSRWHRALAAVAGAIVLLGAAVLGVVYVRSGGLSGGIPGVPGAGAPQDSFPVDVPLGWAHHKAVSLFEGDVARALAAAPTDTTPVRARIQVSVQDVLWNDSAGRPFVSVPRADGWLETAALKRNRIQLSDLVIQQPRVLLVQPDSQSAWNYVSVLGLDRTGQASPAAVGAGGEGGVFLRNVTIQGGHVELQMPGHHYVARALDATVSGVDLPPGNRPPVVRVARLTSTLLPDSSPALALQLSTATLSLPQGRTEFQVARLQLGETVLTHAQGVWDPSLPGYGVKASGLAEHVRLADLRFISANLPEEGTASFVWSVEPRPRGVYIRTSNLVLRSQGSEVTGRLAALIGGPAGLRIDSVDVSAEPLSMSLLNRFVPVTLPYSGTVTGRVRGTAESLGLEADAKLSAAGASHPFTVHMAGVAAMSDRGVRLRHVEANLDSVPLAPLMKILHGLPLGGTVSGHMTLTGAPGAGQLHVNTRLDVADGTVVLTGTVDPSSAEPTYDLDGRLIAVKLQQVMQPRVPPVVLTTHFTLRGRGLDPSTLQASASADGHFSGWYTGPDDRIDMKASAGDGLLKLSSFSVAMGPLSATAHGQWGLRPDVMAPGLVYDVRLTSLAPFGPYLPGAGTASGTLRLSGTAAGTLRRPSLKGTLQLQEMRWGPWGAGAAEGSYDIILGDSIPVVHLDVGARGVDTPRFGAFEAVSLKGALTPPSFTLDAKVDRAGAGVVELGADGSLLAGGARTATVRHLVADLGNQRWALQAPAQVRWGPGSDLVVDSLKLTASNGGGRLSLNGTLLPLSRTDVTFDVAALPAGQVQTLLGQAPRFTGQLWVSGKIVGGGQPVIDAHYRVENGQAQDIAFSRFEGSLEYHDDTAVAKTTLVLSPSGDVRLDATLPVALDLSDTVAYRWVGDGSLSGRLVSDSLPLELAGRLAPGLSQPQGVLNADVRLAGTPNAPSFQGSVDLSGGAVTVAGLGRRFDDIHGSLALDGRTIRVRDVQARSDGTATLSGDIRFEQLSRPVADLTLSLDKFRPFGLKSQRAAASWGKITVSGPIPDVTLGGQLTVNDGNIQVPKFTTDALQQQVEQMMQTGDIEVPNLPGANIGGFFFGNLAVKDLNVVAGDNLWFEMDQARAQLSGSLVVNKSGDAITARGLLTGDHGTFTMQAGPIVRRFEIKTAQIRFYGEPTPNPGLQITASRVIYTQDGQMEITASVGGTARNPTLSLSTSEGVQVPESEILSVLLFGQQSFGLGGGLVGGQGSVSNTLVAGTLLGGLTDYASMQLEQALVQQLGVPLDYFQLRTEAGAVFANPRVVVGKEVGNNLFLTVDAGLGALFNDNGVNAWGMSLEWHMDQEWTLEGGIEPVIRRRLNRLGIVVVSPLANPGMQYTIDLLRRWTY